MVLRLREEVRNPVGHFSVVDAQYEHVMKVVEDTIVDLDLLRGASSESSARAEAQRLLLPCRKEMKRRMPACATLDKALQRDAEVRPSRLPTPHPAHACPLRKVGPAVCVRSRASPCSSS